MGGLGSGNWYCRLDKKRTTEAAKRIDVRYMRQHDLLTSGQWGTLSWTQRGEPSGSVRYHVELDALILDYCFQAYGGKWQTVTERIPLEYTPCHYGGSRPWFRCPHCTRRVAVLYRQGKRFLCRHCYNLTYTCQQENPASRLLSKAQKIRQRLGGSGNMYEAFPPKPKGMHWRTYWRLRVEAEGAWLQSLVPIMGRFGIGPSST